MHLLKNHFEKMVSLINLFECWDLFKRGKRKKSDVQLFEYDLEDNIFQLHNDLVNHRYCHGSYTHFRVFDPKERSIHAASVRDRLVHQMLYSTLTGLIDKRLIFHSLSSRLHKGVHFGIKQLEKMIRKTSANYSQPCYSLKLDIKRYFDSIDHLTLKTLIIKQGVEMHIIDLINAVIDSFSIPGPSDRLVGIPLGNLTSQLFGNLYLHELDCFIKHHLRFKHYLRYCDDFIFLHHCGDHLKALVPQIQEFLSKKLRLSLHPKKIILRKLNHGIDFIGYALFEKHQLLRLKTNKRMKKRLRSAYHYYLNGSTSPELMDQTLQSYLGILSHANQYDLSLSLKNRYWIRDPK